MLKSLSSSNAALALAGFAFATHYRLVGWTNRIIREPAENFYQPFDSNPAVIVAVWHGEAFLIPFFGRRGDRLTPLATTHRDGEILTRAGSYYGLRFIRGSGDHGKDFVRKKAVRAFTAMLRELRSGGSVVMTPDVPKVARVAGPGIIALARYSQCPIVPVAMASSRRYRLSNWERTCINLPFGRMAFVRGDEIRVARDADEAAAATARQQVESALNAVTQRAYDLANNASK